MHRSFLEALQGMWPPVSFHDGGDGRSVLFKVDDLGSYGTGTVRLESMLRPLLEQTAFRLEITCAMHDQTLTQVSQQKAYAQVETLIEQ